MQRNILELYSKAQSQQLEAQEVAWLESQTREHPYFGMAYMVLARHHLGNKSTIKDKALLKSAAYARDRGLLRGYLEGVITTPKAAAAVPLEKQSVAPNNDVPVEPVAEELAEKKAVSTAETVTAPSPVEEKVATEAVPEPKVEATAPTSENKDTEASNDPQEASSEAKAATVVETEAQEVPINWYVNMHLKLRSEKYAGRSGKLLEEIAQYPVADPGPATSTQVAEIANPNPVAITASEPPLVTGPENKASDQEISTTKIAAEVPASKPAARKRKPRTTPKETLAKTAEADPLVKEPDDYEIGSFSSFTFMDDGTDPEADESEIDTMMPLAEAVEFETDLSGRGPGQITFEEKDRIVEVSVSPDELERYFKGRLPVELNFSPSIPSVNDEKSDRGEEEEKKTTEFSGPLTEEGPVGKNRKALASNLIERFIEEEPTISRVGSIEVPTGDLSATSTEDDDEWVTETLAAIYEKQGNKSRAIQIYEKLALRFPEKSDYFAVLIQKLK